MLQLIRPLETELRVQKHHVQLATLNSVNMNYYRNLLLISVIFCALKGYAQDDRVFKTFPLADSLVKRIGIEEQIAGKIFGGQYFKDKGVTLLYMGDPYPNHIITLLINEKTE